MTLESLDRLRSDALDFAPNIRRKVCMDAEEIEREIAEKCMELPVDAAGVPIHVGDKLKGVYETFEVCAINEHYAYWCEGRHWDKATECTHVKQRTVEDVLRDCCNEWNEHCGDDWESGVYAKYANELRDLIKEGEL